MDLMDFQPHRRFGTRTEARAALDDTLSETRHFLRIFDDDGSFWGFERKTFSDALSALLRRHADHRVIIVLHDASHVARNCPRLVQLLRSFAPRLQVLGTDAEIRGYARGLVLSDDGVLLRRPHFGQAVTFIDYDEKAIAAAGALFEDILGHASQAIAPHTTGL
jgi:hypothetical protein